MTLKRPTQSRKCRTCFDGASAKLVHDTAWASQALTGVRVCVR
jgi:hypothetical protein